MYRMHTEKIITFELLDSGYFEFRLNISEIDVFSTGHVPGLAERQKLESEGRMISFDRLTIHDDMALYFFGVGTNMSESELQKVPAVLMPGAMGCLFFVDVTTEIPHGYFEEVNKTYISPGKVPLLIVATHARTHADLTRVGKALEADAPVIPFDPDSQKSARYVLAEALKHFSRWRHTQLQRSIEATEFAIQWHNSLT
ncbi:MAG: hypothetical protein AAF787_10525 [Chloroflexota bacterium]